MAVTVEAGSLRANDGTGRVLATAVLDAEARIASASAEIPDAEPEPAQ